MNKAILLGWDGVPPRIIFDELLDFMPNLKKLLNTSYYGPLRSTKPPITIPAWMSMMTGCDPGQLGIYGFRHRQPGDYKKIWVPDSSKITAPKIWDIVGNKGGKVVVIGVPPTFPPPKVNGILVSGFIAPDTNHKYTYPKSFANRIKELVGDYKLDIFYRTEDKEKLKADLFEMTKKRHELAKYLLQNEEWDLFVLMEVGPDRLHHGFWRFFDKEHKLYEEDNQYNSIFEEYYGLLDTQLGEILSLMPEDCVFTLASDHGAKGRKGAFCINEWLQDKGMLKLEKELSHPQPFDKLQINWKETKAWAWGGYYARIFINVEGYEERGIITPEEYEEFRDKLKELLKNIRGPNGEIWHNTVDKPEDIYEECTGDYPDLMVYFDDLRWRASASMGYGSYYYYENSTGPDDAMHDWDGIYIIKFPKQTSAEHTRRNILDIAPTLLNFINITIPQYMKGTTIRGH